MPPRNLIVIVADTLRHPEEFSDGHGTPMPFLADFSKDATTFERIFASSSWTAPSHVSLLSGAPPWETHFHVPGAGPRSPRAHSLADSWQEAGAMSVAFSANFLVAPALGTATGYARYNPGFKSGLAGYAQLAVTYSGYEARLYRAYERAHNVHSGAFSRALEAATRWGGTGLYKSINSIRSGEALTKALARFLQQRRAVAARANTPLHLFINIAEPHEPYLVGQNGGAAGSPATMGHVPSINLARFTEFLANRSGGDGFRDAYRASLVATDQVLHGIIDLLKRDGLLDNAALLFVSDHGQNLGEHGFYGHGFFLYDELVKVPGFLREWSNGQPVGHTAPPDEWIDHRHLNDLLVSFRPDGGTVDVNEVLSQSLVRRGPAASYFEGPGTRPPDGLLAKPRRPAPYRLLRLQRGHETVLLRGDTAGGNVERLSAESTESDSDALAEIGDRILRYELTKSAPPGSSTAGMDAQVDARLKSWGYD